MPSQPDRVVMGPVGPPAGGGLLRLVRRFGVFLRKYWWIPSLTGLLGLAGAVAFIVLTPPAYVSYSAMWQPERLHLTEGASFTDDASTYLGTQIELLKSSKLRDDAYRLMQVTDTNAVPLAKDGTPLPIQLTFKETPRSSVFVISASSADAAYSQNFLGALMTNYLTYKKEKRKDVADVTVDSIKTEIENMEREVQTNLESYASFNRTNNVGILQVQATRAGDHLEKLKTDLSDLRMEAQLLRSFMTESNVPPMANAEGRAVLDLTRNLNQPNPAGANNAATTPYQELELLKIERDKKARKLRPAHPTMIALNAEIDRCQKLIDLFGEQNRSQLLSSQEEVQMKMTNTAASIREWETNVNQSSDLLAEADRLRQNLNNSSSLYEKLKGLQQNLEITRNTDLETLDVLESATPAKRSYKEVITTGALGIVGSLVLGLAIVLLLEKRDDRFTSVAEVNSILGDAIFGMLPEVAAKGKEPVRLLEKDDTRHGYVESYRRLRSALLFQAIDGERPKVLLITSAMPNEGKSTVAGNLARTLAMSGASVLLVDADLRRGCLHRLLNAKPEPGLAELLRGTCQFENVVQRNLLPKLSFIPCGGPATDTGDLLPGADLERLFTEWRKQFDYVIIDSCPLFAADDTSCLAPKVDGTLFVVRRNHSGARAVGEAVELLNLRQARLLGVIFNGADPSARDYYYYKFAGYNPTAKTA